MNGINADLSQRISVDTETLPWQPSPSGTVWRKRLYLDGPAESGKVTSLVRYDPDAVFPAHDHPRGEEILVLGGVFSDEHGDWPAGSYLLNPEGFHHAPFSREGCLIFVRLRQYDGLGRKHVAVCTHDIAWQADQHPGIDIKSLYSDNRYPDCRRLERWPANTSPGSIHYPQGAEIFVLEGELRDEAGSYRALTWLRLPPGASHTPCSTTGCELFISAPVY